MIARLLIYPSLKTLASHLASHLTSGNVNHPDTLYFKAGEKLGIAEARKIKKHFFLKSYSAKGRSVIIEDAGVMTIEAQNALLKTIEELPKDASFILGSTSESNLLPTILSRCEIIKIQETSDKRQDNKEEIEKLLNNSLEERFEYVEKTKNKEELLFSLVSYFHQYILKFPEFTEKLLQAEEWHKQNVNIRAILEYLMLVMPARK
ncbi:MAG: hypothetical protein Q7R77_04465 [Candidatus Daviesbacteria bacterium]|nr:hypothetical protein [Candidatus Daviesbacteria bacterium]